MAACRPQGTPLGSSSGRMALPRIEPSDLESYVGSKGDQLVCILCTRFDDPVCCKVEAVACRVHST